MLPKAIGFEVLPINLLWEQPDKLVQCIKTINDQNEDRYWRYTKRTVDLKEVCPSAPPRGGAHLPKLIIWQPSNMSAGSVLVPNYRDGMVQLVRHINRRFRIRYFSTLLSNDPIKEGISRFEHGTKNGALRVAQAILNDSWEWYAKGRLLPFENADYYKRETIPERLTPEVIISYAEILGWNLDDTGFWKSEGCAWIIEKMRFK